jgi:hypothetical protein
MSRKPYASLRIGLLGGLLFLVVANASRAADEPPALNPFGPPPKTGIVQREDAIPGYIELSNGAVYYGRLYITRDKRLQVNDEKLARQRMIPLEAVKQIDCKVVREWVEREWRFKEMANDEKVYTGRSYPSREYEHTLTLKDDRKVVGSVSGIFYLLPGDYAAKPGTPVPEVQPERFTLHKRDKGQMGDNLSSLLWVKTIKLGEEAFKEGKQLYLARQGKEKPSATAKSGRKPVDP